MEESNAAQTKEVNEEYKKMLSSQNKPIVELKAAVVKFQTREVLRMEESMAMQTLLEQQSNLIKSLQQLSGRQVIKKVKHYSFYY